MRQIRESVDVASKRRLGRSKGAGSAAVLALVLLFILAVQVSTPHSSRAQAEAMEVQRSRVPRNGFVPDSITAVRIAEAVLIPVYGVELVQAEKPFIARLRGNVWLVRGTLHPLEPGKRVAGGVAEVEIAKRDARIIRMSHGR